MSGNMQNTTKQYERRSEMWLKGEFERINDWYYEEYRDLCEFDDEEEENGNRTTHRGDSFDLMVADLDRNYERQVDSLIEKAFNRGVSFEVVVNICGFENANRNLW